MPTGLTDDEDRLAALASYDILDTPPEGGYDDVVQLARLICDAPIALVSLVAQNRQWFKARDGFDECETDLNSSVCAHALGEPDLLIVPDLTVDPRTSANPLVTGPAAIRFYAGAPLRTAEGHTLGSLCVIDMVARPEGLTLSQAEALRTLARQVMTQLDLRKALSERDGLLVSQREADRRRDALLRVGDRLRELDTAAEMIDAASRIVGEALGATRAGFGRLDADSESVTITDWTAEGVASIAGRHRFQDYGDLLPDVLAGNPLIIEDVRSDHRTAADPSAMLALNIGSLVNMPVREHGRTVALLIVQDDKPRAWPGETLAFIRNVADRLEAGVARLRAEAEQRVLNHELSHRMKNTMAMVQAIAIQTLKRVPDRAPVDELMQRIHALSDAHDMLLADSWSAAKLDAITQSAMRRFAGAGRMAASGPSIEVGPRAALSTSMLLHELATNAVKYGAFSNEAGRVDVDWSLSGPADAQQLTLRWRESGGPPALAPARRGFGSRLIAMGLVGTGGSELRYLPTGLEAEFTAPLEQVQQS